MRFHDVPVVLQAVAANMDEQPNSNFVDLIKNLLNNPEERERFFQVRVNVAHILF